MGIDRDETLAVRRFASQVPKHRALTDFVKRVMETEGFVEDGDVAAVRQAGYSDGQIAEVIAMMALATFSNYFNHVHDTPLDFPQAAEV